MSRKDITPRGAIYKENNSERCARCKHNRWFHQGLNEPFCDYLGSCQCRGFESEKDDGMGRGEDVVIERDGEEKRTSESS